MKLRIFQINSMRDAVKENPRRNIFRDYNPVSFTWDIYDKVFERELEAETLDDIYISLNVMSSSYDMRSLSVSDIIEVVESSQVEAGFYYIEHIGYRKIEGQRSFNFSGEQVSVIKESLIYSIEQAEYHISEGNYSQDDEEKMKSMIQSWEELLDSLS